MNKISVSKLKLPDKPGVYFFLDQNKKLLYIGKATSLKNRTLSYFAKDLKEKRSELIEKMVSEAFTIDFTETDSVLEALILETNLIRTHKPLYNTKSKDDKSFNHLIITNETWPRVLVVRERDLIERFLPQEIKYKFGPFTSGILFRDVLKIVRKLFKFYDTKNTIESEKSKMSLGKIDFNRQIGLYPDPNNRAEYLRTIRHLKLFFQGKKSKIVAELEKEMIKKAKSELFEEANKLKKKIFALRHIEDISLLKNDFSYRELTGARVEAYDIAHLGGKDMVGVLVVVQNSQPLKSEYRKFKIRSLKQANDPAALKEVLQRRFSHTEWEKPEVIVVDGNHIQINAAKAVIDSLGLDISIVAVTKDDKHKAVKIVASEELQRKYKFDILLANSEAHRFAIGFYRKLHRKRLISG